MEWLALFFSARGRLAPRAFAAGAAAVYGTAFLSQLLISAPVMLHAGLAPFALVQAIATWSWFCLHAKRLRECDPRLWRGGRDRGALCAGGDPLPPSRRSDHAARRCRADGERRQCSRLIFADDDADGRSRALRLCGRGDFRARRRTRADGDRALDLGRDAPRRDERGPPVNPRCVAPDHSSANRTG